MFLNPSCGHNEVVSEEKITVNICGERTSLLCGKHLWRKSVAKVCGGEWEVATSERAHILRLWRNDWYGHKLRQRYNFLYLSVLVLRHKTTPLPYSALHSTMPWPAHIVKKSNRLLDTETIENKFYGLYDSIIHECFPTTQFTITPQYPTAEATTGGTGAIDFAITYVIEPLEFESPVFFIEVKAPTHLPSITTRKDAENQVRYRFRQLAHLVQIPKLYGVSALGRQLSYYTYDKASGRVEPGVLTDSTEVVVDTAPLVRWNTNIMEEEGRAKFLAVVEEIKQMVADLGTGLCLLLFKFNLTFPYIILAAL